LLGGSKLEKKFRTPLNKKDISDLKVGDTIFISGILITARDAAHKRMLQYLKEGRKIPVEFTNLPLFHCGPLVKNVRNKWKVIAAGPTTSIRMEPYESEIIKELSVRLIIGKGGIGKKTKKAMKNFGAAYGTFTGGAAVIAASKIIEVKKVEWLDLGLPEALWVLKVKDFGPLLITIDTNENDFYEKVMVKAKENVKKGF
jgi:fumarate hydratase subunit beta